MWEGNKSKIFSFSLHHKCQMCELILSNEIGMQTIVKNVFLCLCMSLLGYFCVRLTSHNLYPWVLCFSLKNLLKPLRFNLTPTRKEQIYVTFTPDLAQNVFQQNVKGKNIDPKKFFIGGSVRRRCHVDFV